MTPTTELSVNLTWEEFVHAWNAAGMRVLASASRGDRPAHGAADGVDGDMLHLAGCRGEIAVAKAMNFYWSPKVGVYRTAADVGGRIEVRTRSKPHYDLIIRADDDPLRPYVLVIDGQNETRRRLQIIGWILGRDGRRQEWLKDPTNKGRAAAWFVPQSALNDMASLPDRLDQIALMIQNRRQIVNGAGVSP